MHFAAFRSPIALLGFAAVTLLSTASAQASTGTVTVGQAVSIAVAADGTTPFTYQWYKGSSAITGATSATYSISSAQLSDAGNYYAVVANSAGSTTSDLAVLTVNAGTSAPVFTTQPSSQTVTAGSSVTFTAAASGTPTPTYQWRKNGTNIAGATSSSYSIASVVAGDAGTYSVVATNSAGSATSNNATLTVNPATSAPVFTTQPTSQTVTAGTSVTFTGAASGTPTPTYQWRKDGTNISGATNGSYTIANVATSDAGTYTLVATNSAGSATSNGATLTVNAAPPTTTAPTITTQPTSQTATAGTSVTFTGAASGNPAPTYQWRKDGSDISGATSSSFTIASVASSDAGTYTLVATNSAGSATSNGATLTVSAASPPPSVAPAITTQPTSQTATVGATAAFTAGASGSPTPTYQWQRQPAGSTTWVNLNEGGCYQGACRNSITVSSVTAGMSGDQFRCVAVNAAGSATSNAVTLTVPGTSGALFQFPASINEDSAGNFYVADTSNNTIDKVTAAGVVTTFAGTAGLAGSRDGVGTSALFNQPGGVVVDSAGNIYVADTSNATIRKITASGTVTTLAGSAAVRGSQDGTGTAALFSSPVGLALDGAGNLYVADAFNATIRKITPAGVVTTLAGSAGSRGDADGTGAAARFNFPNGVAVDAAGNVYVADTYNDTIRKITPAGVVSTLAGSAGISGATDLTGSNALFNQPYGLAVDAAGNVYVADTGNGTIRRITPDGAVSTVAGIAGIAGHTDGPGASALFNQPRSLVIDGNGNIYVADTGNGTLRKIALDNTVTTLALTAGSSGGSTPPPSGDTPPPSGGSSGGTASASGGGGGSIQPWFVLALMLFGAARRLTRKFSNRPLRRW